MKILFIDTLVNDNLFRFIQSNVKWLLWNIKTKLFLKNNTRQMSSVNNDALNW